MQPYKQEIVANLERAEESVEAATILLTEGFPDFAASRAYYSVFYASTAALLWQGLEFSKHSGVIAAIHRNFIKTGRLPKNLGKDLNWLFELRNIGDYGDTRHVPSADAMQAIQAATEFLRAVKKMLEVEDNAP